MQLTVNELLEALKMRASKLQTDEYVRPDDALRKIEKIQELLDAIKTLYESRITGVKYES